MPEDLGREWQQWEVARSARLVDIAQAWRQLETDDDRVWCLIIKRAIASGAAPDPCLYAESTDQRPDRTRSTAILREALDLAPQNLVARCLLAQNEADSAYRGEGTWDEGRVRDMISELEHIAARLDKGPVGQEDQLALDSLHEHLVQVFGLEPKYWEPESIREWWQSNSHRLRDAHSRESVQPSKRE